jgi:3-phosphoshikimate 1-carboxyvinyltransferase
LDVIGSQVSKSYIDITIDIMKTFGVEVENQNYQKYIIKNNSKYKIDEYKVEGDYSSASYFAAMAALTESRIELKNLNQNSKQGDKLVLEILAKMGAKVEFKPNSIIVQGRELKPVKVDMENAIDQPPVIAVLAAFIDGITEIDGVGILKYKESDRLLAIQNELLKMGIKTKTSQDKNSLKIFGGSPKGAEIETYGDHRIAMAFAISGLKIPNMKIKNPEVVKKSFPNFWEVFESLRA